MKKLLLLFCLAALIPALNLNIYSQTSKNANQEYFVEDRMSAFFDLGYGKYSLSGAIGFQYPVFSSFDNFLNKFSVGASIGLTSVINDAPGSVNYTTPTQSYELKKFTTLVLCIDIPIYYHITENINGFASVGYYSQTDSLFLKTGDGQYWQNTLKPYETENGLAFGFGAQYFLEQFIGFGVGYHTKRGFFAQFNYFWY